MLPTKQETSYSTSHLSAPPSNEIPQCDQNAKHAHAHKHNKIPEAVAFLCEFRSVYVSTICGFMSHSNSVSL